MTTKFQTFEAPKVDVIGLIAEKVSILNPITGQTELYLVEVTYEPNSSCIESEAVGNYLAKFADLKMHGEVFTATIADELFEAIKPLALSVRTTNGTDGFAKTTVASRR